MSPRVSGTSFIRLSPFVPKLFVLSIRIFMEAGVYCVSFWIPWTKTTRELGTVISFTGRYPFDSEVCPYQAFELHCKVNAAVPDSFSLFVYLDDKGTPQHMTKDSFLGLCFSIWEREAMKDVLGHSFCIGGAVYLLLAGVPPEMVAKIGGWTSLAFLIYWRGIDEIVAKGTITAYQKEELKELKKVKKFMDDYRKANGISASLIEAAANGITCTLDDFLPDS
jgi:hypothetical protein